MSTYSYTNSKGATYYLHSQETKLKNGRLQRNYFFAKDIREDNALDAIPEGRVITEGRNGLPVLKKAE